MSGGFDKSASVRMKGAAILLMLTHHLFAFPEWILPGNEFSGILMHGRPLAAYAGEFGKICVAIYALLTGVAMRYAYRDGALRESYARTLKRLPRFYVGYWAALALLVPVLAAVGETSFSVKEILLNLSGLRTSYCPFAWYVRFYAATVILFPLWVWLYDALRRRMRWSAAAYGCLLLALWLAYRLLNRAHIPGKIYFIEYLTYTPMAVTGYAIAREGWDERAAGALERLPCWARASLCVGAIALCALCRSRIRSVAAFNLDVLYAAAAVFAAWRLLDALNCRPLNAALALLGRTSAELWYLHAVFFMGSWTIQRAAYWPRLPALILPWTAAILLPFALAIQWLVNGIFRKIPGREHG